MPLAHIDFKPRRRTRAGTDALLPVVSWYRSCLWKNGQVTANSVVASLDGAVRLTVMLIGRAALEPAAQARYVRASFDAAASPCDPAPRWTIAGPDGEPDRVANWRSAPSLYLGIELASDGGCPAALNQPLRHGAAGRRVPTYSVPIADDFRERLSGWWSRCGDLLSLWLDSADLEIESYRCLADPRRTACKDGRDFAAAIEVATGVPTYLQLFRHYAHKAGERSRPCPGCGGRWARRMASNQGLGAFAFRCDRCRLVSHPGTADNEPARLARIGDWSGGEPIEPAASLRKRVRSNTLCV